MKEKDFQRLLQGIKEASLIRKGLLKPGRVFKFDPIEVKKIRNKLPQSQCQIGAHRPQRNS